MACGPIPGRLKTAAIFPLDNCLHPIYGEKTGYIDDCPAQFTTTDNMDEGTPYKKPCIDGTPAYYDPGIQTLQNVEVSLDLNAEPADEWLDAVGLVTPVKNGDEVIGYTRCSKSKANLLILMWQELLGGDACDEEGGSIGWRLHLFVLRNARLTFEGNIGAEDGFIRITGMTSAEANLGRVSIPILVGPDRKPTYPKTDLVVCHHTVIKKDVAPPPEGCGVVPTVPPKAEIAKTGKPGKFLPFGSLPPADLSGMSDIKADPETKWGDGEYVVLGDKSEATWDGEKWINANVPTGATAGEPGKFTPDGSTPPANIDELKAANIKADPETPWKSTEYVVLGDGSFAKWNGTGWVPTTPDFAEKLTK